jgi:hypothetical protein
MGASTKLLRLKHSGRLGDIVYSFMAVKHYCDAHELQIEYSLWDNPAMKNLSDEGHMYPGGINDAAYEFIKPWLLSRDCLVSKYVGQKSLDLDLVKQMGKAIGLPYSDIRKWYQFAYPEFAGKLYFDTNYRHDVDSDLIVISRSRRWQNIHIDYTVLNDLDQELVFIGSNDEFDEMKQMVPRLGRRYVTDLKDAEALIRSASLFIGNQSLFYAIAEFNQVPRMLEVCDYAPNVVSQGKNHHDFITQHGFAHILEYLCQ